MCHNLRDRELADKAHGRRDTDAARERGHSDSAARLEGLLG
jgi:hypothetical protein